MADIITLTSGDATAVVHADGGRLASLRVGDTELLVTEGPRPTRWGSFPMVPWCGRLRDARLRFDGLTYDFPATSPPHANHGFGHLSEWERTGDAELTLPLADPWPFGGKVVQRFELADAELTVHIEVHAGDRPMPAMAGWHPWFRRELGIGAPAELVLDGGRVYAVADDGIPTGELVAPPPGPWDACFVGFGADPVIRWPGALALTLSSSFDHWVVFTEPEHALCVEPESGAPDEPNRSPRVVEPGAPLVGRMTLRWAPDAG